MESTVANNTRSSVTADSSVPSTPTTPSASSSGRRFLLAENRYGREEMLALMPDQPTRPPMNSELESILLDEAITPLALLPLTEDEQKILAGPVNSYSAYKRAPPNSLPVRGRGGRPHRGRGRGEAGSYPRSLSTSDEHMGNGAGSGEWGGYYPGGAGRATTTGWTPGWEGTLPPTPSRGDKDSNWRSPAKDPNGKWNTPPSPGGLTRGGSWKAKENKDRWLPGWAQNSKEGGEGEGKGAGPDEQPEDKNKEVKEKEKETSEQKAQSQPVVHDVPPRQPKSSSPWGRKEEPPAEESLVQQEPPPPPQAPSDQPPPPLSTPSTLPQPTQPILAKTRQPKPPSTNTNVFPSALSVAKETVAKEAVTKEAVTKETTAATEPLPTSLPAQGLAGIFSTPNFTPTFGPVAPADVLDPDRFEKDAEALLSTEDEETTFRTNKTNLLHSTDFQFTPVSSIIGPKAEVIPSSGPTPTEQSLQQAPPLSQTISSQQKPQPVNHATPPQPLQQVLQPQYKGEDQHSWYYKDPQSNVQGPFPSSDMKEWFDEGYFTLDLMVRRACDDIMLPLGQVIRVWGFVPFVKGQKPPPPIKASEPFWSNLFSRQTALFQQQQAYMMQAQQTLQLAQAQAQAQQVAAAQQLLVQQQQQQLAAVHHHHQQQQTAGVPSTTWSLTAVAAQAPPLLATSVASPAHPTPPLSSPSTSQEPQRQVDKGQPPQQQRQVDKGQPPQQQRQVDKGQPPRQQRQVDKGQPPQQQRQVDKGQPPQQQRQKKVQESSRREVVEQPKVAKQETPPPVDSAPSQWPSFKDVWDSSSSSEEEEETVVPPPAPQPPTSVGPWGKKTSALENKEKLAAERRKKEEDERRREEERRQQREEEEERERHRKQKEEEELKKRQEEEKRKQQELHKKREERQRKKRVELDLQKDLWSPQDEVEMGGAEQVEGGIDQMWSTDQRGIHMPWPGVPVSSPVGALSLLEIQEQEFKHAEQKKAEESQQRREVLLEHKLAQQNKTSWASTTKKNLPVATSAKSFAEIQREQEEAMQRVSTSITQAQSSPTISHSLAWMNKSPNSAPYKPPPGWATREAPSRPRSGGAQSLVQMQMESASFWEEVMEGDGNEYNGSGGDAHRNSTASGPAPLSSRVKGEASKKKAPIEGAEGRKLPPPPLSWKPTEDFIAWCEGELGKFEQRADSTVFLEYLQGCSTANEIHDMIITLFEEEASKAREFAHRFIEKRQKMISGSRLSDASSSKNPSVHPRSSHGRPTGSTSLAAGGVSKSASSKKTKKGKKGQKLDPVLLGFSVHAADRPNIGEIQSVNSSRR